MDDAKRMTHGLVMASQKHRGLAERPLVSVVDDDESVRESLPDLLKEFGFTPRAFSSADAFLSSGTVDETKCLILDVAMPGMSGLELQQELNVSEAMVLVLGLPVWVYERQVFSSSSSSGKPR